MNSASKAHAAQDPPPPRSTIEDASDDAARKPTAPLNRPEGARLETPEEIARALHVGPTRLNRAPNGVVVVLAALVGMCLVMAVVVWWRLLS